VEREGDVEGSSHLSCKACSFCCHSCSQRLLLLCRALANGSCNPCSLWWLLWCKALASQTWNFCRQRLREALASGSCHSCSQWLLLLCKILTIES
jgi:hypothetical protein